MSNNYPDYHWPGLDFEAYVGVSQTRNDENNPDSGTVQCWRFAACTLGAALGGISYLKGVPGMPLEGPGPGACGRVSCGFDCGIWWCNDVRETTPNECLHLLGDLPLQVLTYICLPQNPFSLVLGGFNWIADYANQIQQDCDYMGSGDTMTFGQAFHPTEDWNVILAKPA